MDVDRQALEANGGKWDDGDWKGPRSSRHTISDAAVKCMDDTIIDNINAKVGKHDSLWILGDVAICKNYYATVAGYMDRIKCDNVHLIRGNHDRPSIDCLFKTAKDHDLIKVEGIWLHLSHCAYLTWFKSHHGPRGSVNLHGHSHGSLDEFKRTTLPGLRSKDVGVDCAFKDLGRYEPYSFDEVLGYIGTGFFPDHHQPEEE
jgi:calcineurin-like phosphoesterase family protein